VSNAASPYQAPFQRTSVVPLFPVGQVNVHFGLHTFCIIDDVCWFCQYYILTSCFRVSKERPFTVAGTNLCVSRQLQVKTKGIRGFGGGGGSRKGIIYYMCYKHYFPAAALCNALSQLLYWQYHWFTSYMYLVSFYAQASDVGETHSLVPTTTHST
jgi:hypothetical protein